MSQVGPTHNEQASELSMGKKASSASTAGGAEEDEEPVEKAPRRFGSLFGMKGDSALSNKVRGRATTPRRRLVLNVVHDE